MSLPLSAILGETHEDAVFVFTIVFLVLNFAFPTN